MYFLIANTKNNSSYDFFQMSQSSMCHHIALDYANLVYQIVVGLRITACMNWQNWDQICVTYL